MYFLNGKNDFRVIRLTVKINANAVRAIHKIVRRLGLIYLTVEVRSVSAGGFHESKHTCHLPRDLWTVHAFIGWVCHDPMTHRLWCNEVALTSNMFCESDVLAICFNKCKLQHCLKTVFFPLFVAFQGACGYPWCEWHRSKIQVKVSAWDGDFRKRSRIKCMMAALGEGAGPWSSSLYTCSQVRLKCPTKLPVL